VLIERRLRLTLPSLAGEDSNLGQSFTLAGEDSNLGQSFPLAVADSNLGQSFPLAGEDSNLGWSLRPIFLLVEAKVNPVLLLLNE